MLQKITMFILYLAAIVGVGFWSYQKTKTSEDFYLGGRGLGPWIVAIATKATDMSGWLLLGVPGIAYIYGISGFWMLASMCFWDIILWFFISKRLRRYSGLLGSMTMAEFFSDRLRDERRIIQVVAGVLILFFMTAYISAQLTAAGKTFADAFGLSYTTSLVISTIVIVLYCMSGGIYATALVNLIQGLMMVSALVIAPLLALRHIGGWSGLINGLAAASQGGEYALLLPNAGLSGKPFFMGLLLSVFFTAGFGEPGIPHVVVHFMAAKDAKDMRQSALVGLLWLVMSFFGAVMIGLIARVYSLGGLADPETSLPFLVDSLLGPWFAGFVFAAIMAAIMSTADTQIVVATAAIFRDVFEKGFKWVPKSDREQIMWSRVLVIAVVLGSFVLARIPGAVFFLVVFAWAGMAVSFCPLMIASLYWRRLTLPGAIWSMVGGAATCLIWNFTPALQSQLHFQWPAMVVSTAVLVIVSLFTKPPEGIEEELLSISAPRPAS